MEKKTWGNIVFKEKIMIGLNKIKTDKDIEGYMVTHNFAKKYLSENCAKYINKSDKNYLYFQASNSYEWLILAYELYNLELKIFNNKNYSDDAFRMYLEYNLSTYYKQYSIEKGFYISEKNEEQKIKTNIKSNSIMKKQVVVQKKTTIEPFNLDIFKKELLENNSYSEADDILNTIGDDSLSAKGYYYYKKEQYLDAKKCYLRNLDNAINDTTLYDLGVIYMKEKKHDYAKIAFKQVINMNPTHFESYFNLGFIYYEVDKNPKKALILFKNALILNPEDSDCEKAVKIIEKEIMNEMLDV